MSLNRKECLERKHLIVGLHCCEAERAVPALQSSTELLILEK